MKKNVLLALCAASALVLPACIIVVDENGSSVHGLWSDGHGSPHLHGSGVARSESRALAEFERIQLNGSADVRVKIGPERAVLVTGDDNLVGKLATRVEGGLLTIEMEPGSYSFRVQPVVDITVPALSELRIAGSGDARIAGLSGGSFTVEVNGSGDVTADGAVDELHAAVNGSGDLSLYGLGARLAWASISGSGDIELSASERITAQISGSGDIRFHGQVSLESRISGSGTIRQR